MSNLLCATITKMVFTGVEMLVPLVVPVIVMLWVLLAVAVSGVVTVPLILSVVGVL